MDSLFNRLKELVLNYDNVIIMSHINPDLDALGSSLGMSSILNSLGVDNRIFLDTKKYEDNSAIKLALSLVSNDVFINKKNYKDYLKNTLLIVLDTHKTERVEYPKLIEDIDNVVVLDHHIKSTDYIKDTEIFYIDSTLSSVVELISCFAKSIEVTLPPIVATIMLAGMQIDTDGFNIKISERAFTSAAFLVSMGADSVIIKHLLKESKEEFLRKADFIKSSYVYKEKYAICLLDSTESTPEELAGISQELLNFEEVEASFTIGYLEKKLIGISARSMDSIDVCEIMTKLGGGGHATSAAVQIKGNTIKEVERSLKKVLGD